MTNLPPPPPGFGNRGQKKEEEIPIVTINEKISHIFATTLSQRHQQDKVIMAYIMKYVDCRHNGEASRSVGIAAHEGNNLRKHADVAEAIKKVAALATEEFGFAADDLVQRLKDIADFDPLDIYDQDTGLFKHIKDLPFEARMSIREFECENVMEKDANGIETGRVISQVLKYKFYDRPDQVKVLGREKNLFKERKVVENNVTHSLNTKLLAGLQRAEQGRIGMRDVGEGTGDE